MAKVRRAALADLPALVAMGEAMHAESPRYQCMQFDPAKVEALLQQITEAPASAGLVLVAESGGEPVGTAVAVAAQRWFGPDWYVTDLAVYVRPEHRGSSAFSRLVDAIETWAAARGIEEVDIGVSTGVHVEQTVRAYERKGYTLSPTRIVTKKLTHGR